MRPTPFGAVVLGGIIGPGDATPEAYMLSEQSLQDGGNASLYFPSGATSLDACAVVLIGPGEATPEAYILSEQSLQDGISKIYDHSTRGRRIPLRRIYGWSSHSLISYTLSTSLCPYMPIVPPPDDLSDGSDEITPEYFLMSHRERIQQMRKYELTLQMFDSTFLEERSRMEGDWHIAAAKTIRGIAHMIVRSLILWISRCITLVLISHRSCKPCANLKNTFGLNVRTVAQYREAYDLLVHLWESEEGMINKFARDHPSDPPPTHSPHASRLYEMSQNALNREDCVYRPAELLVGIPKLLIHLDIDTSCFLIGNHTNQHAP